MAYVERIKETERRSEQAAGEATPDRGELLNMAVLHHQAGRLDEADGLYRLLLDVDLDFAAALHLSCLIRLARDHPLIEMWAYKCDQELSGLNKYADCAAVNINFWISPDDANCDPESGGLEVFKAEALMSWDFRRYNNEQDAIDEYLEEQGSESLIIPHRANRALVFNSNLFHETDDCHFCADYSNRRTNITMLFGHRFNR